MELSSDDRPARAGDTKNQNEILFGLQLSLHDTVHRYEASTAPFSALAARRAFFAALAAAAFAFFASALATYNNRQ
jgi:hypothetical protein